jgi:hypothetical protein
MVVGKQPGKDKSDNSQQRNSSDERRQITYDDHLVTCDDDVIVVILLTDLIDAFTGYNFPGGMLRFDPVTQEQSSSRGRFDNRYGDGCFSGALADDGVIYCAPFHASRVLAIDPFRLLSVTIKNDYMSFYPQELGRSFVHTGESYRESLFHIVVRKFGHDRAYGLLDE